MNLILTVLLCQADVADIPSQDLRAGGDANKRYFLIGPKKDAGAPEGGFGLLLVLPGGSGSADFHPFVKRIYKHAVGDGFIAAQLVSMKWTPDQRIIWPTSKSRVAGMKFTTEQFIETVIRDVRKKHKLDARRIFTLSWSSGGPAAYAASLSGGSVKGSFVAMSVFKPNTLPPLARAKGHAYYLYHSPEDPICPIAQARDAAVRLKKSGARTTLVEYPGGHRWGGPIYPNIRKGIAWLESNSSK